MSHHILELTLEAGSLGGFTAKAKCYDQTADCHYQCDEGCESWGRIVRNEAGAVMGHEVDEWSKISTLHRMTHVFDCNWKDWVENCEITEIMEQDSITFTIPVRYQFHGDYVTWTEAAK